MSDPSSQPTQPLTEPTTVESAAADALAAQIHRVTGLRVDAAGCADMARTAIAAVRPLIEAPYAQAALKIAIALDTLGGRIYRDIHPETADIAEDPEVDKVLTGFMAYAKERLAVLDDPEVKAVLDAAMARRDEEAQR